MGSVVMGPIRTFTKTYIVSIESKSVQVDMIAEEEEKEKERDIWSYFNF